MTVTCCSSILRVIDITTPRGPLALAYCERCDKRRWYHDGVEVNLRDVLDLAASDWRNNRLWKNPERRLHAAS